MKKQRYLEGRRAHYLRHGFKDDGMSMFLLLEVEEELYDEWISKGLEPPTYDLESKDTILNFRGLVPKPD